MKNKPKTIAFLGVCTALAMVLAYVEILLPPLFPSIPGIKMGLPNIIIVLNFVLNSIFLIVEIRIRYFGYILIGYVIVLFNILTDIG